MSRNSTFPSPRPNSRILITDPQTPEAQKVYGPSLAQLPPDARKLRGIEFARMPQGSLYLDIYLPAKADKPLPLIIWVHGGGWHTDSKARDAFTPGRMVGRGYALASIDYRDSKEAIFPAQVQDCKAAIRWLRANADGYGIDPKRFGVWGISAGGHLAALIGTSDGVKEFDGDGGNLEHSSRPLAICDMCGPTDFFNTDGTEAANALPMLRQAFEDLVGGDLEENRARAVQANPITHIDPSDPPYLIIHGDADPLVAAKQSDLLYEALRNRNMEVTYCVVKGGSHLVFGPEVDRQVDAFFDKHLKSASPSR